jgi:hypothetical protein
VLGAGKYDDACTAARLSTEAAGVVLIVLGGPKGPGFSVQAPLEFLTALPGVLRNVADQIEGDAKG